jgi:hypothetical protein
MPSPRGSSRPHLHPSIPSSSSLQGLEKPLPRLSRPNSPALTISSIASSVNKPLPPSPHPLKTPPLPTYRSSYLSGYSEGSLQREKIIDSYASRSPSPAPSSIHDELLPPRVFANSTAGKSSQSLAIPETSLPRTVYRGKGEYTASDTMLAVRGAKVMGQEIGSDYPSEIPFTLEPATPYPVDEVSSFDAQAPLVQDSSISFCQKSPYLPYRPVNHPAPVISFYEDRFPDVDQQNDIRPQFSPNKPPLWRHSEDNHTPIAETSTLAPDNSAVFADLYRNTLPPAPHRPALRPPDLQLYRSHNMSSQSLPKLSSQNLPRQVPRASQIPMSPNDEATTTPASHFSDPTPDTPHGTTFTTLRKLAQRALNRHQGSSEDEERDQVLATTEKKYPAMAPNRPHFPSTPQSKRMSIKQGHRLSISDRVGDMYDTLSSFTPIRARTPSQSAFPSTYTWTPITPTAANKFSYDQDQQAPIATNEAQTSNYAPGRSVSPMPPGTTSLERDHEELIREYHDHKATSPLRHSISFGQQLPLPQDPDQRRKKFSFESGASQEQLEETHTFIQPPQPEQVQWNHAPTQRQHYLPEPRERHPSAGLSSTQVSSIHNVPGPPKRGRQKPPAVPLTPYQMYGEKIWEDELRANHRWSRRKHKKPASLDFNAPAPRSGSHSTAQSRDSKDGGKSLPPCAPATLVGQKDGKKEPAGRFDAAASPRTPPSVVTPKLPKVIDVLRSRTNTDEVQDQGKGEGTGGSWLQRRKAKREEERQEKWREETKKRIKVVGGATVGGKAGEGTIGMGRKEGWL